MKFVIRLLGICFFGVAAYVYYKNKGAQLEPIIQSAVVGLTLFLLPSLVSTPQEKSSQENDEKETSSSVPAVQANKGAKKKGKPNKEETTVESKAKPKQKEKPQSEKDEEKSKAKNRKRKERRKKAEKGDDDDEEETENYMIQRMAQQDAEFKQVEARRVATQAALKKAVEDAAKKEQRRKNKDDKKKQQSSDQNWSTVGAKQAVKSSKGGGHPNPNAPLTGTGVGGRPIPGLKAPTAATASGGASEPQRVSQGSKVPQGATGHTSISINVLNKHHGIIIGPKGETLKKLQSGSGATINMPKKEAKSNVIVLEGSATAVRDCEAAIQSLISKGFSKYTHADQLTNEIAVPPESFGKIIGPKGVLLKAIQDKTKTKINIPGPGQGNKITLVGSKEGMKAAKDAIKSLLDHGYSSLTHEGFIREEVPFPYEKRGFLIGPRGQSIKSIQGNTRAQITLPENKQFVVVAGTQASINAAKKAIAKILNPPERKERDFGDIDPNDPIAGDDGGDDGGEYEYHYPEPDAPRATEGEAEGGAEAGDGGDGGVAEAEAVEEAGPESKGNEEEDF